MTYTLLFFSINEYTSEHSVFLIPDDQFDDSKLINIAQIFYYQGEERKKASRKALKKIYSLFKDKYYSFYIGKLNDDDHPDEIIDKNISHVYFI